MTLIASHPDERGEPTRFQIVCDWPGCHTATAVTTRGHAIRDALALGFAFSARVTDPDSPGSSIAGDWCRACWDRLKVGWPAPADNPPQPAESPADTSGEP